MKKRTFLLKLIILIVIIASYFYVDFISIPFFFKYILFIFALLIAFLAGWLDFLLDKIIKIEVAQATQKKHCVFKEIPDELLEIITSNKQYAIEEENESEALIVLDNDYSHWIHKKYIIKL